MKWPPCCFARDFKPQMAFSSFSLYLFPSDPLSLCPSFPPSLPLSPCVYLSPFVGLNWCNLIHLFHSIELFHLVTLFHSITHRHFFSLSPAVAARRGHNCRHLPTALPLPLSPLRQRADSIHTAAITAGRGLVPVTQLEVWRLDVSVAIFQNCIPTLGTFFSFADQVQPGQDRVLIKPF